MALEECVGGELLGVVSRGLAETFRRRPEDPVEFLGRWLVTRAGAASAAGGAGGGRAEEEARAAVLHGAEERAYAARVAAVERGREAQAAVDGRARLRGRAEAASDVEAFFLGEFCEEARRVFGLRNVYALREDPPGALNVAAADERNRAWLGATPARDCALYDLLAQGDGASSYAPDAVADGARVHFWDVPRLGAQLAVLLEVPDYATAEAFDDLAQRRGESDAGEQPPAARTRRYVLVADNLGESEELAPALRDELLALCAAVREAWARRNLQNLHDDCALYEQLLAALPAEPDPELKQSAPRGERGLEELREALAAAKPSLLGLGGLNFLKFDSVVRFALQCAARAARGLLAGLVGEAAWQRLRGFFTDEAIDGLLGLDAEQPVSGALPDELCTPALLARVEAEDAAAVGAFFPPLGALLAFLRGFLAQRLAAVERQRGEAAEAGRLRGERLRAGEELAERERRELEEAKRAFYADPAGEEEPDAPRDFDERGWREAWQAANPAVEIPPEAALAPAADVPVDHVFRG